MIRAEHNRGYGAGGRRGRRTVGADEGGEGCRHRRKVAVILDAGQNFFVVAPDRFINTTSTTLFDVLLCVHFGLIVLCLHPVQGCQ